MSGLCHDFKTQRKGVSGGLPDYYKIIPLMFYIALVFCTVGYTWFEMRRRAAVSELARWEGVAAQHEADIARVGRERKDIEVQNDQAKNLAKWMEGGHNLQPLLVCRGRSAGDEATIAEIIMDRNAEIPSQIQFTLKMDGVTSDVLDQTLQGMREANFRAYTAQQQKTEGALDYNAVLVYQEN